jgi:hypothetical protein
MNDKWTATDRAIANLKEAIRILESNGPSLLADLYDTQDAPDWRINSAKEYIHQALTDLAE